MSPTVFWPALLGIVFLIAGVIAYWRDARASARRPLFAIVALAPAFIAAPLAAFAGEHFTITAAIAGLVPQWMPGREFIAVFVGVAHLAAALSFVTRRFMRWSTLALALMFGMFVLLMDLPGALATPTVPLSWMMAARQTSFAIGALALYATRGRSEYAASSRTSATIATIARVWIGIVLVAYGVQHLVHPEFAPGVPSPVVTATWVPFASAISYATGALLVAFGVMMLLNQYASVSAALAGTLMLLLTVVLYGTQFIVARGADEQITAVNFVFDTMLFAGTLLVVSQAISAEKTQRVSSLAEQPA